MNGLPQAFGIGTLAGIILFFVLAKLGYIDRFLNWIERR
jgi:hypothetical protein